MTFLLWILKNRWNLQSQLSNLRWMPNSVRIGFGPAMKMGSSRRFKRYPTTYMWVSSWLPFTMDEGLSWFILIHSKGMRTWNSHIDCGVLLESSWWAHFHGRVKTFADWVWYLSKIGELWRYKDILRCGAPGEEVTVENNWRKPWWCAFVHLFFYPKIERPGTLSAP